MYLKPKNLNKFKTMKTTKRLYYSLRFKINDVLESFECFKIHDVLTFYISFSFIENCVTNDVL